nr:MAG: major capsid protein [Microvirus sp.]
MRPVETIPVNPQDVPLTSRPDIPKVITSTKAGTITPVWVAPLLREDKVSSGRMRVQVVSEETIHPIMNPVKAVVSAHFIPFFAFDRFAVGMDAFNRSYAMEPEVHNGTPIQFFQSISFDRAAPFWKALGIHEIQGAAINASYLEAYNTMVNFRRKARSSKLPLRLWNDTTLAEAFWHNPNMEHIVPDFEQAMADGTVPLTLSGQAPVSGIGLVGTGGARGAGLAARGVQASLDWTSAATPNANQTHMPVRGDSATGADTGLVIKMAAGALSSARPAIFAELANMTGQVSLANIELAKKTAAFAKVREKYEGLSADHLMDLLMEGIRVPDEMMRQPILLAQKAAIFGFNERFATDAANLDVSRSNAQCVVDIQFRTPPMNTGGIIMVSVEIVPEPLFERQHDNFLRVMTPDKLPNFIRDFLDPDQVEVVENRYPDALHASPTGLFGYAPMNHAWRRELRRVGGKFYRPNPDTFVEDRLRFWAVEKLNPSLVADFYMVPAALPHNVFENSAADPFEVVCIGPGLTVVGRTQFGQRLIEDDGHYAAIDAQVDKTRVISV